MVLLSFILQQDLAMVRGVLGEKLAYLLLAALLYIGRDIH